MKGAQSEDDDDSDVNIRFWGRAVQIGAPPSRLDGTKWSTHLGSAK